MRTGRAAAVAQQAAKDSAPDVSGTIMILCNGAIKSGLLLP